MPRPTIRIGNQTTYHVPARLTLDFALRHGFDAFEWFSDEGRTGWCEDDVPADERAELRRTAQAHENWGDGDSPLALFTGPSARDDGGLRALVGRLKRRGFVGSVVMEQWPEPPEVLVGTRRRLRQLLEEV